MYKLFENKNPFAKKNQNTLFLHSLVVMCKHLFFSFILMQGLRPNLQMANKHHIK